MTFALCCLRGMCEKALLFTNATRDVFFVASQCAQNGCVNNG